MYQIVYRTLNKKQIDEKATCMNNTKNAKE